MSVTFNRPKGMKYTDMCIYIDKHMREVAEPNAHPEVEEKIFEYLYHILYALSCKAGYFKHFEDYDSFAMYGAGELYISMRDRIINEGKEVHGRIKKPIKNTLDFIKAVMFPLKINYQRENFGEVIDPAFCDTGTIERDLKNSIQAQYSPDLEDSYTSAIAEVPETLKKIISKTPFRDDPIICKKLYMSALITFIDSITLPNKIKQKIMPKDDTVMPSDKFVKKYTDAFVANKMIPATRWHIDEEIDNYIKLLVVQAKKEFSKNLNYYIHCNDLSDELLDNIMQTAYDNYDNDRGDDY